MIKAEELMIGDKVRITDVETNLEKQRGVFATVCKIEKEGNYWSLTVMPDNDKHTYFIEREEEFEFVPLTPEILEKNGFEERHDYFPYVYFLLKESGDSDNYSISLKKEYDTERREEYWSCSVGNYNADATIAIHYAHELQHALRLCGIPKEIEL